jgi:hypothetical protein
MTIVSARNTPRAVMRICQQNQADTLIPARMAFFAEWLITGRDAPKIDLQPEPI